MHGPPRKEEPAPPPGPTVQTFGAYWPAFIANARANRQKASTIAAKEMIGRKYLLPVFTERRLDEVTNTDVEALKRSLGDKHPKTVNNVLSVLAKSLKRAVEWKDTTGLARMPCDIRLVRAPEPEMSAYSDDEYGALVDAAKGISQRAHLMVLLGGEAGLRIGELVALRNVDVDTKRGIVHVRRNV